MRINRQTLPLLIVSTAAVVTALTFWYNPSANDKAFDRGSTATASSAVDRAIASLEARIAVGTNDHGMYLGLASAYLQRIRETQDLSYYERITKLLDKAKEMKSNDPRVPALQARVKYGLHDFAGGLQDARTAVQLDDGQPAYHGLLGDGYLELGEYDKAVSSYQRMVDLRPDYNSYTRIAYIRELYGDVTGAKEAMELAISAGAPYPENIAWAQVEFGKLAMRQNLDEAERFFKQALEVFPDYAPALAQLGGVYYFRNDVDSALKYFERATELLPIADYAMARGDLYAFHGEQTKAEQQYLLAKLAFENAEKNGVNTNLEFSTFLSERDLEPKLALEKAQRVYTARPTIFAADALAWAFYRNGDLANALRYSTDSMRLGEYDPGILFHVGMMKKASGDTKEAKRLLTKALEVNPYFSLRNTPVARTTLKELSP